MKQIPIRVLITATVGLLIFAGAGTALSDEGPMREGSRGGSCGHDFRDPPGEGFSHGPHGPRGPHDRHGPFGDDMDWSRPPPYLAALELTDEQQDKVFTLLNGGAAALREQAKAARKAREQLHEMAHAEKYDGAAAIALAQSLGKAESQLALLHAQSDQKIYAVLTPDQRRHLAEHGEGHRPSAPGP